ncbi:hypothetical protein ACJJTC_000848 [Scirpophaga incertulas]
MVVETRSKSKNKIREMEGQNVTSVVHGTPHASRSGVGSVVSSSSVSGSTNISVNNAILSIRSEYAKKVVEMERLALERERKFMEHERAVLELQMQEQISALEDRQSVRSRRRSKTASKLSSKFVHKWLDECFDSAIPPILASDNNEFSRNQVVQGPSQHNCVPAHDPIKSILLENARPSQPSNNNRVSTNMQPKSLGGYANITPQVSFHFALIHPVLVHGPAYFVPQLMLIGIFHYFALELCIGKVF